MRESGPAESGGRKVGPLSLCDCPPHTRTRSRLHPDLMMGLGIHWHWLRMLSSGKEMGVQGEIIGHRNKSVSETRFN